VGVSLFSGEIRVYKKEEMNEAWAWIWE